MVNRIEQSRACWEAGWARVLMKPVANVPQVGPSRISIEQVNQWQTLGGWSALPLPLLTGALLAAQGPGPAICYVIATLLLGAVLGRLTDSIDDLVVRECHRDGAPEGVSVPGGAAMLGTVLARVGLSLVLAAWWAQ